MPTLNIKITDEEKRALKKIAKIAEKAYKEHFKDPVKHTFEEAFEILDNE